MGSVLRGVGVDVLPAGVDAQVDQAFRLSGLMSGQVAVSIRPDNLPAVFQQFAAWAQGSPLPAWVCCQRNAQAPGKLHLSATSSPIILYYNFPLIRNLLPLTANQQVL